MGNGSISAIDTVIVLAYLAIDIPLIGTQQVITKHLGIPFMQVGWYLFLMSSAIYITVSLITPAPSGKQLDNLCWTRPLDALRGRIEGPLTDPRVMATILFILMAILYTILH